MSNEKKKGERMRKYIPLNDREGLKEAGCPYTAATLYKHRCRGNYPRLTVKIGGTVCLNVRELERMASRSIKEQEKVARAKAINNG